MKLFRSHILVSVDDTSLSHGVKEYIHMLKEELKKNNLTDEIDVLETGPVGYFGTGINMVIYPENITYVNVTKDDIPEIISEHFIKGRPVKRLVLDTSFLKRYDFNYKRRIVLDNSGNINPEDIEEYIGANGYLSWEKALLEMKPEEIISEIKNSKLVGRGGAGFPTGLKMSFTAPLQADQKYVVVNADEGEPGTFKDRLIMEGDPHKLLEGVMISAYAVGATKAFIYIRGEYKLCIERLKKAIEQAYEYGLLGKNIFDTGFDLDISLKIGAGAYVCGEETALIESMEGNRGNPRNKPPYPGVKGVWEKPTLVNNVETLANIPAIIKNGADWYKSYGTEHCTGTKVYTILGDVKYPGLCEVDMGVSLRTIIEKFGGGVKDNKQFKAALVGGAAGVILPNSLLDVNMDFHSLKEYAAVLGSGAILVMNEDVDIVEILYSILRFFKHESCGKCSPCSKGTQQLLVLIEKIRNGEGTMEDLDYLRLISDTMEKTSFCPLGQSPILPITSALDNFKDDFLKRIRK